MDAILVGDERERVEFHGSALGLFGRTLLNIVGMYLVIPAPWITAWYYRWIVGNLKLRNGIQFSFTGTGGQIWLAVMISALVGGTPGFLNMVKGHGFVPFWVVFLAMPVSWYLFLIILRWFWRNVELSSGGKFSFVGKYLPLLGWNLFLILSLVTIVGWAWVALAMTRWFCRNIVGDHMVIEFHGDGWNMLWRNVAFILSCFLIIPIPWTSLWLFKWYAGNTSFKQEFEAPAVAIQAEA